MLNGEDVTVELIGEPTFNEMGEESHTRTRADVSDVLVAPGSTSDMGADRPNGDTVAYTLYFPKSFDASLRGCSVVVRGERFDVLGDPKRYTDANVPGKWNLVAEVGRTDG